MAEATGSDVREFMPASIVARRRFPPVPVAARSSPEEPHPFYAGWRRLSGRDKCNRNNSDRVAHRRAAWRDARPQTTLVCVRRRKISSACFPPRFFVLYGAARAARRRAALFIRTTSCQKLAGHILGDAGWSSPVARQAHNLKVRGSNPLPATTDSGPPEASALGG